MSNRHKRHRVAKPLRPPADRMGSHLSRLQMHGASEAPHGYGGGERELNSSDRDINVNSIPIHCPRIRGASTRNTASPSLSAPALGHTITIDEDGELRLVMSSEDDQDTFFIVCPRTLARASGVWRQMLYGNRPSLSGLQVPSPWTVPVSDDISTEALTTLLHIAHGNFANVPPAVDTATLSQIILAAELYEMISFLCPFLERWLRAVPSNPFLPRQVWIPWILGHRPLFLDTAAALVSCLHIDGDGRICVPGSASYDLESKLEEMGIIDQLKRLHRKTLADVLHILQRTIERLEREPPISGPAHEACQSAMLGRLIRELSQHGLWPLADAQVDQNIGTTLSIIRQGTLPFPMDNNPDHINCNQVIDDMLQELNDCEGVTLQLTSAQLSHLRNKARGNGLRKIRGPNRSQSKRNGKKNQRAIEVVEIKDED